MSDRAEMEAAIEAVLFVSSEPVPRARLLELFEEEEREQAAEALAAVLARYAGGEARGVMVEEVAGGVRLVTRPEMGVWLRRFFEVASGSKLSMAALETLAIVGYRQPITGPEIQELRGVSPVGVLKTLLEKRLVRIAGRKEVVGKPFLYATTREFLVHFGLNSLRDLPPLEEFEETFGAASGGLGGRGGPLIEAGGGPLAAAGGASLAAEAEAVAEAEASDREERILREAAALDEREDDEEERGEHEERGEREDGEEEGGEHGEHEEREEGGDHAERPSTEAMDGWDEAGAEGADEEAEEVAAPEVKAVR